MPIYGFETEMDVESVNFKLYNEVMELEGITQEDFKNHNKRLSHKFRALWRV